MFGDFGYVVFFLPPHHFLFVGTIHVSMQSWFLVWGHWVFVLKEEILLVVFMLSLFVCGRLKV